MHDDSDYPGIWFWFITALAGLVAIFVLFFLAAPASADIPIPRPKPVCETEVTTWRQAGVIEESGAGTVTYMAGGELASWLAAFNKFPPSSEYRADFAVIMTLSGRYSDLRLFEAGCMVGRAVFPKANWDKMSKIIEKMRGVPV